jgi:hypothetical protein
MITKLQPDRTMALRGFDNLGASGALHSAGPNGFTVSGNFRDASDFCVLMLWDVDDYYEHPSFKYLPDSNFAGLTLTFDVQYSGLQPLDSNKYPTIAWPYLDYIQMDGTSGQVALFPYATQAGGNYTPASATFTVVDNGLQPFDRVTLWYLNIAFDYIVPNPAAGATATTIAASLALLINTTNYAQLGASIGLTATATGNQITVTAAKPGVDGNMIQLYQLNKNSNLLLTPSAANLSGGDSGAVWQIALDFSALGLTDMRQMWLTFAPPLANGAAYAGGDWEAVFTNWTLAGPTATQALQVAGLNSVRIQQSDSACTYSGTWQPSPPGFYDQAFAQRATAIGSTVRIEYNSAVTHDLYVGTLLAADAGLAGIQLDGDTQTTLDCALSNTDIVITRRLVRSSVAPGSHVVAIVLTLGEYIDFNFLEAAFPSDVPPPLAPRPNLSPALDFDTDHTYKNPPARILWMFDQMGFTGPINEYLGVFWWNQRVNVNGSIPALTVQFGGAWADGDAIFLEIGTPLASNPSQIDTTQPISTISKSVFPADTSEPIAAHFAAYINAVFSGIWASANGADLVVSVRSAAYSFALAVSPQTTTTAGTITLTGMLTGGSLGEWNVDPTQTPTLNTGARAWHSDFYALCQARGTDVVTSISMELVNPPSSFAALFQDGTPVTTATGFGSYVSTQCATGGPIVAFQQTVLSDIAALQTAAALTPFVQLGEFLWWYFAEQNVPSMAYYDPATVAAAQAALGRDLALFATPHDSPSLNGGADAVFLRNRLRDHVADLVSALKVAYPTIRIELLLPLDVNYPTPVGPAGAQVGGQLNNFVNIPVEWQSSTTAGFDLLKIEALSFGSTARSLDLANAAITTGFAVSWPSAARRYLVPVFGTASPWQKEVNLAILSGYPIVNLWAFDHICLYGWDITPGAFTGSARSSYQG